MAKKTIAGFKKDYEAARKKGDYLAMRTANVGANAIRKSKGLPSYNSSEGDKQFSLNTSKGAKGLKQNITKQTVKNLPSKSISNVNIKTPGLSSNHPLKRENKSVNPLSMSVTNEMFDKKETYVDKAKKGNYKGSALNFLGTGIQAPQALYLNTLNNATSIARGKGIQPYKYNMDYSDYEKEVAKREGEKTVTQKLSEKSKALGKIYNTSMNIATDPTILMDAATIMKAKGLKKTGSAQYLDSIQKGNLVPTKGLPTRKTKASIGSKVEAEKPRATQFKDKDSYIDEIVEELAARHNPRNLTTSEMKIRDNKIAKELDKVANMITPEFKKYARQNRITKGQLPQLHSNIEKNIKLPAKPIPNTAMQEPMKRNLFNQKITKQLNAEGLRTKLNIPKVDKTPLNVGTPVINLERGNKGTIAKDMGDGNFLILFDNKSTGKQALIKMNESQFSPIEQIVQDLERKRAFNKAKSQLKNSPQAVLNMAQNKNQLADANFNSNNPNLNNIKAQPHATKLEAFANKDIEGRYKTFMSEFDGEPTGNTGVGEWVKDIRSKGVGISKDITRNADAALKGEARNWFKDTFEDNFYKSKGQYAKNVQKKTDMLFNEVVKKRGIKKGSKESAGIQWFGEGQKNNKGEVAPYSLQDLQEDFNYIMPNGKLAWENIVESDGIMRRIYDDYINKINESLKSIYPNAEQEVTKMQASKQGKSLEEMAQIDREIDKYLTGKRLMPRKDYYHHFQELQNGFFSQLDNILNSATNIDPNLVGISKYTKPKSKFMGALQHRTKSADYKADAIEGMLQYIPQAEYKVNIEPNIPVLRNMIKDLKDYTGGNANQFIDYLMKFTNDLAGKTNTIDRGIILDTIGDENGRKLLNSLGTISNRIRANAVVGNLNTVLAQYFNMPNVVGYAKNPIDILDGMVTATKATIGNKEAREIIGKSDFLRERYLDRSMRKFDTGIMNDLNKFFAWSLEVGDKAVADSAFVTFYKQGLKKGLQESEAIRFADNLTRKSVAGRGIGEMPLEQKSKLVKLFAPFQVEVRNAYNVLKELGSEKDTRGILSIFATTWIMNQALEAGTGRRIGFDPIDVLMNAFQEGEGKTTGENIRDTTFRMGGEALTNMPFGSYLGEGITGAMGLDEYKKRQLFGESDPTRFGTGNIAIQTLAAPIGQAVQEKNIDLLKPALAVLPKFGGKQIERSIRGLQDMAVLPKEKINLKGGSSFKKQSFPASFSNAGRLRFSIDPTVENYLKAPTLGTWATDEGKGYIKNKLQPMSEKQTELVENITELGISPVKADNAVRSVYKGISKYKEDTSKNNLSTLEKAYIVDESIKNKAIKSKLYDHLKISQDTIDRYNYLQNKNISINQTSEANQLTKKFDTTLGKTIALIDKYPENGEILAKGLGYSDNSIKNAKKLIENGVSSKQFETYKKNADTNKDGKINAIEAHRILKDEPLTMSQKLHLIKNLKGDSLKEKNKN